MNTDQTIKQFNFKQFSLITGTCGMPVSTDSVLLGAWAQYKDPERILDIGTGTGILALMCAQRFPEASITALDIDPKSIETASYNAQQSPWTNRVRIKQQDILMYQPKVRFDAIICNPPYFSSGETSTVFSRALARHTFDLPHEQLIRQCCHIMTPSGRASFILPYTEGQKFIDAAHATGWSLSRYCAVQPTSNKSCSRILIELSSESIRQCQTSSLVIRENQHYSDEFIALTRNFYLKM